MWKYAGERANGTIWQWDNVGECALGFSELSSLFWERVLRRSEQSLGLREPSFFCGSVLEVCGSYLGIPNKKWSNFHRPLSCIF